MEKVRLVEGVAAGFPQDNIDTDAIIPAAYQRSLKLDAGKGLFAGWRYDLKGAENPVFVLNRPPYREAKILVSNRNFGCGSSREFAVWALKRFGIGCVIAESFGDIFYENAFKNGLLLVTLPPEQIATLHRYLEDSNSSRLSVDLEACTISRDGHGVIRFSIPESRRQALLEGWDEIGQTLRFADDIEAFQRELRTSQPWIFPRRADAPAP